MSGVVLDPDGRPISGAQFNHTGPQSSGPNTELNGSFEVATKASAMVIRREGYKSVRLKIGNSSGTTVTLDPLDRTIPGCDGQDATVGIIGFGSRFAFRPSPPNQSESPVERLGLLRSDLLDKDATRNPDDPGHGPNLRLTYKLQGKTVTEIFPSPGCSA